MLVDTTSILWGLDLVPAIFKQSKTDHFVVISVFEFFFSYHFDPFCSMHSVVANHFVAEVLLPNIHFIVFSICLSIL